MSRVGNLSMLNTIIEPITPISLVYSKQLKLIPTRGREMADKKHILFLALYHGVQLWNLGSGALQERLLVL